MKSPHLIRSAVAAVLLFGTSAIASAQGPPDCNSQSSQTVALQNLLDQGGQGGPIVLQADNCLYGYNIDATLHFRSGTTLTSSSAYGNSALLIAMPSLNTPMMVVDSGASGYTISNIWFYGNRFNRTSPNCTQDSQQSANLWLHGSGWLLDNIESDTSPCLTGTLVDPDASSFEIRNSWFANNGWDMPGGCNSSQCWADGLTVLSCSSGYIHDNNFRDNTDIDLIIGPGTNCTAQNNHIQHIQTFGYGGFMVGFGGDHSGSMYSGNNVSASSNTLGFGIMVGHHPWDVSTSISNAGTVTSNAASGSAINLAVEGIGAGTVAGNTVSGAQGTRIYASCASIPQNYTVYVPHAGTATLDPGWFNLQFDNGNCVPQ